MNTENNELTELLLKSLDGDSQAYILFLKKAGVFLDQWLKRKISSHFEREEVVQETLVALHKSKHTYSVDRPFMAWMMAIAYYKLSDHRRLQYRKLNTTDELGQIQDTELNVLEKRVQTETEAQLIKEIDNLDANSKEVLRLTKIDGLSIKQTALKMGISEANVKVISHRAIKELKERVNSI